MSQRSYQIAIAQVETVGLFEMNPDTLGTAWVPGTTSTRYKREWRLSRPDIEGDRWFGRIGFVKPGEVTTLAWDQAQMDFVEGIASGGVVVPFVLDLATGVVAFQLRAGLIRTRTFSGALESLLNAEGTYRWTVSTLFLRRSYAEWRQNVSAVTAFSFRIEPPNPNWIGRERVRALVEDLETEWTRLSGKGDSIDDTADLFRESLDHTLLGYGQARIDGITQEGQHSEWRATKEEPGIVPATTRVDLESDEVEAPRDALTEALETLAHMLDAGIDDV